MKTIPFLITVLLVLVSSTTPQKEEIPEKEIRKLRKEVTSKVDLILKEWSNLNAQTAFVDNIHSPADFSYIGIDGSILQYEDFMNEVNRAFNIIDIYDMVINEKNISVLNREVAIVSINYEAKIHMNDQIHDYSNIGLTFVFKETENDWFLTHFHESTSEKFIHISPENPN